MKLNENIEILNEDNMLLMSKFPDKYFDLAFIDPEYGIGMDGGKIGGNNCGIAKEYTKKKWDNKCPDIAFFNEVFRVSKHQIIFGVNYYPYDLFAGGRIFWDKDNTGNFSDGEIAYCSLFNSVRKVKYRWNGMLQENMKHKENRIHPTQKPVGLYQRIILKWLHPNLKIIDTNLGSGSIAIAIDKVNKHEKMNLSLVACEIDNEYYNDAINRIKLETSSSILF